MARLVKVIMLALGLSWCTVVTASDEVARANELIGEGRVQEAFELLEPLEFDLSGDETFDLLFGYAALEAGHISQNIHLQAASLNLGSVSIGAFDEKPVNRLLGIDGEKEGIVYLNPVGAP